MRSANRALSRGKRAAAAAAAWRYVLAWTDSDADALRVILSGALEGTPPACEPTADGFRLYSSRALHNLRFHPVQANQATPTPTADASPYKGPREPRTPLYLYVTRSARLMNRQLDPAGTDDTWTGQGFAPNRADAAADRAVDAAANRSASTPNRWDAAIAAARVALERAGRTLPARA